MTDDFKIGQTVVGTSVMKTKNMPQWGRALQREAERLVKTGKMPSLEEVCAAVLEARKKYANQIRRARRGARRNGKK